MIIEADAARSIVPLARFSSDLLALLSFVPLALFGKEMKLPLALFGKEMKLLTRIETSHMVHSLLSCPVNVIQLCHVMS